jgi:hypothetical protein
VRVVTTVLCCTTLYCNVQEEKQEGRKKDAEPLPIPVKLEVKVLRAVPPAATAAATDAADKNATAELTVLNSKEQQRSREYSKLRICAGVAAPSATTAAASTAAAAGASSVATNGSSRKRKASNSNAVSASSSTTNSSSNGTSSDSGSASAGLLSTHPNTLQQVCAAVVAQLRSPPLVFSGELWRVLILENRYGSELLELLQGVRQVCTANRYCHCPH